MLVMFAIAAILLFISAASALTMSIFAIKYGSNDFAGICIFIFTIIAVYIVYILINFGGM